MKKIIKKAICFICAILFFQSGSIPTYADESAAFYVQTAAALSDGMIRVSVYLKDADNLAGIDAELFFDQTKVSFEGSSLGDSYSSSYSDIYCDNEKSSIHYVMLYPNGNTEDGIVFTADFKLIGSDKSYQPELKVNSLIDNSEDMKEISYSIKYQQSDGKWSDNTDQSGNLADKTIIEDTLKQYGSKTDIKADGKPSGKAVSIDSNNNLNGADASDNEADDNTVSATENGSELLNSESVVNDTENIVSTEVTADSEMGIIDSTEKNDTSDKNAKNKQGDYGVYIVILVLIIGTVAADRVSKFRKNRHN